MMTNKLTSVLSPPSSGPLKSLLSTFESRKIFGSQIIQRAYLHMRGRSSHLFFVKSKLTDGLLS
jgi:hypothetical protein